MMKTTSCAVLLVAALAVGGCGGSSGQRQEKQITVAAYGPFPAETIPVTEGTPERCRREAEGFSRAAVAYLRPFPSDADNYVVIARLQFFEFRAQRCDIAILRNALARRSTLKQRRAIVAGLGFLDDEARRAFTTAP
jgi:hypothetical protein